MWQEKEVSVCFPAYNEEEYIGEAVKDFLSQKPVDEVVVVNNNSTDKTRTIAEKMGAKVVDEDKQGYGYACRSGLKEASGNIIILAEPDGTFVGRDVIKLLSYLDDFDFVLGTRTSKELIHEGADMGKFLKWGNWFLAKVLEILYNGPNLTDVGCTMRAIKKNSLEKIQKNFRVGGNHFSPEMMFVALENGIKTIEVPVNYGTREGKSKITGEKWSSFKLGLKMLWLIICRKFKND